MADQNTQFYAILTNVGAAKQANADALGIPWRITQLGVGDANGTEPTPNATQTRLINEWRRAPLNQLKIDDKNNAIIVAEQVIPAEVGGKWIREIALYDADGDMVAVANCPPTYKPLLNQGSGRTQVVRMNLLVSSSSNVELRIDPSVVLATREYVDSRLTEEINKLDNKQSVRVAATGNVALAGLQVVDGVQLVAGDRLLLPKQTAAKDNGLWVAAAGAWSRATDADTNAEVTPGLVVAVEQGAAFADTIWQLITDAPIILGSTPLTFRDITDGFARLLSPAFAGAPTSTTPDQFDSSKRLMTTDFAKRMGLEYSSFGSVAASTALTATNIGGLISASSATPITITLPSTVGVAQGATIEVISAGTGAVTVAPAAGGDIVYTATGVAGPIVLGLGDSAEFIKLAGQWRLVGGSIMLRYSQMLKDSGFTTRPQFDSAQYLATTEFVQRALGSFSGAVSYGENVTLTKADAGKVIRMAGTGYTVTLPLIASLVEGATFAIQHSGTSGIQTVVVQGGDVIDPGASLVTSLTLNMGDTAILTRAAGNWALIGGSAALSYVDRPTMPQFDSSRQLATTEFVQRALGSFAGSISIAASRALTASDLGKRIELAAGTTITLPATSTVPLGAAVLISAGPLAATARVTVAAGDQLAMGNMAVGVPYTLAAGGDFLAIREAGVWRCHLGTEPMRSSSLFGAALQTPGYQRIPSGKIEQWGRALVQANGTLDITLPVTFPSTGLIVLCSYTSGLGGLAGRCGASFLDESTIRVESAVPGLSVPQTIHWYAIGR